jgi:two-component system NarL family sensor kinase
LQDYCSSINRTGALLLNYQAFDVDESTIATTTASTIYRIVQELVNNTLKHATATTVLVQLVRKGNALSITVEDNGKGFDKNIFKNKQDGMGYQNLKDRIAYLNGTLDIETAPGKGTSVNIEVPDVTI